MSVDETKLRVGPLGRAGRTYRDPLTRLVRVVEVLSNGSGVREAERWNASYTGRLLVHWALFAEGGKYRDRFWNYYLRAGMTSHADEPLFKECLGFTYAEVLVLLQTYRSTADKPYIVDFKESLSPSVPPSRIRGASSAEVGRITGEWSRMAASRHGQYVSGSIQMKTQLQNAADKAFERGLKNAGPSDPRLDAAVGIFLAQLGRDSDALPYLESAVKASVVRPHAYLEIARIRLAPAKAKPDAGGKLSVVQFTGVRELLRQANAQSDQQERYYDLLVELWENAPGKPERGDLAPLAACARIFTHRMDLTLRSAQLHAALGFASDARALCETALLFASDQTMREEFVSLGRSLP
ncbi:MAG: hypothetical protein ABIO94_13500 [Opitutaceae bacterium]